MKCTSLGAPSETLEVATEAIAKELEWGEVRRRAALQAASSAVSPVRPPRSVQVLVSMRAAPINPADLYNVRMGSTPYTPESDALKPPFIAGNDGLAVVVKVGPGVKNLSENDWVIPFKTGMGTWRSLAVWREKDVLKMPVDLMPVEYAAMLRAPPPLPRSLQRCAAPAADPRTRARAQARCAWPTVCWRTTGLSSRATA